jgi:hypothetical protein
LSAAASGAKRGYFDAHLAKWMVLPFAVFYCEMAVPKTITTPLLKCHAGLEGTMGFMHQFFALPAI